MAQNQRIVLQRRKRTMKNYLLPIFVLLIVGCGNRNPANIVVENRIRQTEQTDSIIGDSYERDTIQGDFNGDGKIEYAYSESNPSEYYCLDEVDDGKPNNITFSNPTIPAIETEFQIERLTNEGDLNGDGTDEIGFMVKTIEADGRLRVCNMSCFTLWNVLRILTSWRQMERNSKSIYTR